MNCRFSLLLIQTSNRAHLIPTTVGLTQLLFHTTYVHTDTQCAFLFIYMYILFLPMLCFLIQRNSSTQIYLEISYVFNGRK